MPICGITKNALSCTNDRGHDGAHSWVGLIHDARHRYFFNGKGPLTSVTTALKVYDRSEALVGWAQRETAKSALLHHELITDHLTHHQLIPTCPVCVASGQYWDGPADAAVQWLKRMPGYQRDAAADIGTRVHRLADQVARGELTEQIPEYALAHVEVYQEWRARFKPKYRFIEFGILSVDHDYGGTGDIVARIEKPIKAAGMWLIDIKSGGQLEKGTGVYPEQAMQLAAYGKAGAVGFPGEPKLFRMPPIDRYGILQIKPEGYRFVEMKVTDLTFEAFLHVLDLHRWRTGEAKTILGEEFIRGSA